MVSSWAHLDLYVALNLVKPLPPSPKTSSLLASRPLLASPYLTTPISMPVPQ